MVAINCATFISGPFSRPSAEATAVASLARLPAPVSMRRPA